MIHRISQSQLVLEPTLIWSYLPSHISHQGQLYTNRTFHLLFNPGNNHSFLKMGNMDGWMNGVLGHFYALSRLNWAGDNLG